MKRLKMGDWRLADSKEETEKALPKMEKMAKDPDPQREMQVRSIMGL
jgi:hypothetical protein